MKKLAFIVAALAIGAGPAFAQSQEDQAACTPDVMRTASVLKTKL